MSVSQTLRWQFLNCRREAGIHPEDTSFAYFSTWVTVRGRIATGFLIGRRAVVSLSLIAVGLAFQTGQKSGSIAVEPQLIREGKLQEGLEVLPACRGCFPETGGREQRSRRCTGPIGPRHRSQEVFQPGAAPTPLEKAPARRALAVSFGFARDYRGTERANRCAYKYFLEARISIAPAKWTTNWVDYLSMPGTGIPLTSAM
jgi:hypothetical protein